MRIFNDLYLKTQLRAKIVRMCTLKEWFLTGYTIEEGANWIHGVEKNANPLQDLANQCNLQLERSDYFDMVARDSYGKYVLIFIVVIIIIIRNEYKF